MAYQIEGKDIVINGFEKGIGDTPYTGAGDMRNLEITSITGEAFVQFANTTVTQPPVLNAVAFTASAAADTLTISSTTGLYDGAAIVLNTNSATGLNTGQVYYVTNIVGNTFQVRVGVAFGSAVNITVDGSGTLTTYQFAGVVSYWADQTGGLAGANSVIMCDNNAHVWAIISSSQGALSANTFFFLGNIGGVVSNGTPGTNAVVVWNSYLFVIGSVTGGWDYVKITSLFSGTAPASLWTYTWKTGLGANQINGRIGVIVAKEDGNIYWTSDAGLGSLILEINAATYLPYTFDPTNALTYNLTDTALLVPSSDESTCLAELGQTILIGGRLNFVYVWDKVSIGFTNLLNIPDSNTTQIVASSQNAYFFTGNRGRIYISNGSGVDLYKKIPDYLTGVVSPYYTYYDANFYRNQLLFGLSVRNNATTQISTMAGAWAYDLDTDALRMLNKTTTAGYGSFTNMVVAQPGNSGGQQPNLPGTGLVVASYTIANVYTVDVGTTVPYTNYESYLQTEMIPVGNFIDPFSPSQLEWKTSAPIVTGEGVRISYRLNITDAFTVVGESLTAGMISDMFKANFQKAQWVQFLIELKSTASNPSYVRLTEMRIRDYPSGIEASNRG